MKHAWFSKSQQKNTLNSVKYGSNNKSIHGKRIYYWTEDGKQIEVTQVANNRDGGPKLDDVFYLGMVCKHVTNQERIDYLKNTP